MPKTAPFESHHRRYDEWFERHAAAYHSELLAVRALLPWRGLGLSIGVGSGRFAAPLGIEVGIDPEHAILDYAARRGIAAVQPVGEALPFADSVFDRALCVTTILFSSILPSSTITPSLGQAICPACATIGRASGRRERVKNRLKLA